MSLAEPLAEAQQETDLAGDDEENRSSTCWSETAYDWWKRSQRKRSLAEVPHDPASAARLFVRPTWGAGGGGTGIAFLDDALRRQPCEADALPVVDVRGDCGKTWTAVTLASRFVVTTRPSKFETAVEDPWSVPQAIVLNSTYDITTAKLAYAVRSTLLRQSGTTATSEFNRDMECCLVRVHVMNADDMMGWVSLLEMIRSKLLSSSSDHPTLIVWDGFLSEPHDEASRMEVIYQLGRLMQECSVMIMTTARGKKYAEWEKYVTHRIWLEHNATTSGQGHELQATSQGFRTPFSLSLGGILS